MKKQGMLLVLLWCSLFLISTNADAKITQTDYLDIRILYDNSGSMHPGYRLEGGTRRSQLGVGFFHEYPEFREWLNKLIFSQGELNGKTVSLTVFTEHELTEILPPTSREDINHEKIVEAFETLKRGEQFRYGMHTYLKENLEKFVSGFEGVVWLITDNIIEREGTDSHEDILSFFRILRDKYEYKSVHLYKYPFEDVEQGQDSNLAIYGILVSPDVVDTAVIEHFDRKFVSLKELFAGHEHLKLKDLSVNPLELDGDIKVDILESKGGLFLESQKVRLRLDGEIRSNLTQHTVRCDEEECAKYKIEVQGPFTPDPKARKEFGVRGIPSSRFMKVERSLSGPISPAGSQQVTKIISSKKPITISMKRSGIVAFIKSAFGMRVRYNGNVRFSLYDIKLKLERSYLAGIFGIDQASSVFDIQDIKEITVKPRLVRQKFYLETGSSKGIFLLILLLLLLLPLGFLVWFLLQKQQCRIKVDQKSSVIPFRPFGSHSVTDDGKILGTVRRGFGKDYTFSPMTGVAGLTVKPRAESGKYDITMQNKSIILLIEPLGRGTVKTGGSQTGPTAGSGPRPGSGPVPRPGAGPGSPSPGPPPSSGRPSPGGRFKRPPLK